MANKHLPYNILCMKHNQNADEVAKDENLQQRARKKSTETSKYNRHRKVNK